MHINTSGEAESESPSSFDFAQDKEVLIYYSVAKIRDCLEKQKERKQEKYCCLCAR